MKPPSPCPHCRSEHAWARTAEPPPSLMQRVADDVEVVTVDRYTRRRRLVALLAEAARRADAMARLEMELRRLPEP